MTDKQAHIDSLLLMQLKKGSEKAFSVVFDTYHKYLFVIAVRYLMSENYAEDAVQHTFMKLWEGKESFDYSRGVKNLLFTILKNYILNEIRHNNLAIQKNYELAQLSEEEANSFLEQIEKPDFSYHLLQLIDKLPPQKRAICLLKINEGLTNKEIAERMDISIPTVKSHYTQAIKFLRLHIDKLFIFILSYLQYVVIFK